MLFIDFKIQQRSSFSSVEDAFTEMMQSPLLNNFITVLCVLSSSVFLSIAVAASA